jgi:hypothetical protein
MTQALGESIEEHIDSLRSLRFTLGVPCGQAALRIGVDQDERPIPGDVDSCLTNPPEQQEAGALQIALSAARENENRWLEISPDFSSDSERVEQWTSTAKLRRLEGERLETLLADVVARVSQPKPACGVKVEIKDQLGETA